MLAWLSANWLVVTAVVLYLVANVVPRPDHTNMKPGARTFWQIVDRLCFLTAAALPGNLKAIGALSPIVLQAARSNPVAGSETSGQGENDG